MRAKLLVLLTLCVTAMMFTACVKTVDGRSTGSLSMKRDKVQSLYDRPTREVLAATRDVLAHNGIITSEDTVRLTFEANVDQRRVWVKIEEQEDKLTMLIIQCRGKGGGTDLDLAMFLDKQVAVRLASGTLSTPLTARPPAPNR